MSLFGYIIHREILKAKIEITERGQISVENQIVLFGAGNNCRGVIKFFGRDRIRVIIDNDMGRWGTEVEGIRVISLEEFLAQKTGLPVLITVVSIYSSQSIGEQLKAAGVQYYFSPLLQHGFYKNAADLVERLELEKTEPVFYGNNPFSELIIEELVNRKIKYKILDCLEDDYPLLNREEEKECLISEKEFSSNQTLVITDAKAHDIERFSGKIIHILEEYRLRFSERHRELAQFKDIHRGKRCFLIGNGPSLSFEDLNTLKENHEITFGVNRIYLSFDKTDWRPDYYVLVDSIVLQQDFETVQKLDLPVLFISDNYTEESIKGSKNVFYFSKRENRYDSESFSLDFSQYVYGGSTVIYDAMQIAVYMGFEEIILLGVDMTRVKPGERIPHFYAGNLKGDEKLVKGDVGVVLKVFEIAEKVTKQRGVRILNATRGGNVEAFERVDFDSLFEK